MTEELKEIGLDVGHRRVVRFPRTGREHHHFRDRDREVELEAEEFRALPVAGVAEHRAQAPLLSAPGLRARGTAGAAKPSAMSVLPTSRPSTNNEPQKRPKLH